MSLEHAVQTIAKRGFTDRQARFLVLVARHSGVCVMRQYSSFAGIVFGQKTRMFFAKLVRLGFVSTYDCAHNRGRVYHVRHRAIYEAIGEPDSRLRRPPGVPRALERLMLLDAILENPESLWMSSSTEKLGYLASRGISADDAPRLVIRQGDQRRVRHFPDQLPIGVHHSWERNGTRLSMRGSLVLGRRIGTSSASAAALVCRKPDERSCGRSSSRCARD